jgi:peptidoglycan DL-endopeptidase CwlO
VRQPVTSGNLAVTALGLCLCAGQLATTSGAEAATAPAMTDAATKTVTPTLTMSIPNRSIYWGSKVKVGAKLVNPATHKPVTVGNVRLQAWRKGAYRTWQTKRIGGNGQVTFYSKPLITGAYRVMYVGSSGLRAIAVKGVKVTVRPSGAKVVREAAKHKGAPYQFGAAGPYRFDCSGYTMYVYRKAAGRKLPHNANQQQYYGKHVAKGSKHVGDLIVFRSGGYGTHAAIYAGGGYMWAAPHTGARVQKQKIYSSSYVVRRLV